MDLGIQGLGAEGLEFRALDPEGSDLPSDYSTDIRLLNRHPIIQQTSD
jgi:hypothetical protein